MDTIISIPKFVQNDKKLFDTLKKNIAWQQMNYFKRHVCMYQGDNEEINRLIIQVQSNFNKIVVGAFLNYYENGNEYAPYHADKYNCDTVLVSLGETRILRYKHNITKENTDFILNSGDLLFIPDEINNNYKHSLLKRVKINEPRISILFFLQDLLK